MNNNRKLLLSDGWINSLKDQNIEYLLFNSLKTFGVSTDEFDNFLSFGQRLGRTPLFFFYLIISIRLIPYELFPKFSIMIMILRKLLKIHLFLELKNKLFQKMKKKE